MSEIADLLLPGRCRVERCWTLPALGNLRAAAVASHRSITAMLKADIDGGVTGNEVAVFYFNLSQLGTDDKTAGNGPSHERIALARQIEAASVRLRNWRYYPNALAQAFMTG